MVRTGTLKILNNEAHLDGTLLARCSDPSPLVAARGFVLSRGCKNGGSVQVTGTDGTLGSVSVFCIDTAEPIPFSATETLALAAPRVAIRPNIAKSARKRKTKRKEAKKPVLRKQKSVRRRGTRNPRRAK